MEELLKDYIDNNAVTTRGTLGIYHGYEQRLVGVAVVSWERTLCGYRVAVNHQTEWGPEDDSVDINLEDLLVFIHQQSRKV